MNGHLQNRKQAWAWHRMFEPQAPKAGDFAPDFALCDLYGEISFNLHSALQARPVVLIFGSLT